MINLLVTGGCGFIGSNFINWIYKTNKYNIINFDAMCYCALETNVDKEIRDSDNYTLIKGNLTNIDLVKEVLHMYKLIHLIIHFYLFKIILLELILYYKNINYILCF